MLGENGIEHELDAVGIKHKGGTVCLSYLGNTRAERARQDPDDNVFLPTMDFNTIQSDPSIGAVMCGFDVSALVARGGRWLTFAQMHINYKKIAKAHRFLLDDPECLFILTNDGMLSLTSVRENVTYWQTPPSLLRTPSSQGRARYPRPLDSLYQIENPLLSGSRTSRCWIASWRGKPKSDQCFPQLSGRRHQLDRSRTLMTGDRLDTDIAFGINGGITSLLVLTGVNKRVDFEPAGSPIVPHLVIDSLGDLAVLTSS